MSEQTKNIDQTQIPVWAQLRWKLILAFLLVSVLPVVIVSYFTLTKNRTHSNDQVMRQLESITAMKEQQIIAWLSANEYALELMVANGSSYQSLSSAVQTGGASIALSNTLLAELLEVQGDVSGETYFKKIFLYNADGRVIAATDPLMIGQMITSKPYFEPSLAGIYIQPPHPYYAVGRHTLSMVITHPIEAGVRTVGVLAVELNLDTLSAIMEEHTGLGENGEAYLVSQDNNFMLTESRFEDVVENRAHHSAGIDAVLNGENGQGTYEDYRSVEVIGVYRWIPELNAGLLAEMDHAEAMAAFKATFGFSIMLTGFAMAAAVSLGLFVAWRIAMPIAAMNRAALRIASGDLAQHIVLNRSDEIGLLSQSLNRMAENLQARRQDRQRAEKEVRESQARLVEAQRVARVGNFELNVEEDTIFWSEQIFSLHGLEFREIPPAVEMFFAQAVYADDQEAVAQAVERALQHGEDMNLEYRVVWPDSSIHHISTTGKVDFDDAGEVARVVGTIQDVDAKKRDELEREQLQLGIIDAQKAALKELSTPVIPVMTGILVMPLVGAIDSVRAADIMRSLLEGIEKNKAEVVILDVTGVPFVDTGVAGYLNKTIQAARLKGAHTMVTGMSDAVAETIVDLGINWSNIETLRDLKTGLVAAINRLGLDLNAGGVK
jgi:anti-anti-sigma regulatory factor/HAMP domain-containing protein